MIIILIICALLIIFVKRTKTIQSISKSKRHIFIITTLSIFLLEMGDKSQLLIVIWSAHYGNLFYVILAGIIGMLMANVPAIYLGKFLKKIISFKYLKYVSSLIFILAAIVEIYKN